MKCLMKYEWVKLMRSHLPQGKGVMGACMKLASRAAFRKGIATYCGYKKRSFTRYVVRRYCRY